MSKRSRACEFKPAERTIIQNRDCGCIFCRMNYHNDELTEYEKNVFEIMHYIPRSAGGLGNRENAAVGCKGHHTMLDNGNSGRREEMMELFKAYLIRMNPGWEEQRYNKWKWTDQN